MKVSIVIAGVSGDRVVENCLSSIRRAGSEQNPEILVLRGDPSTVFELRRRGLVQATGERIAVLGDRYEATGGWLKALSREDLPEVAAGCVAPAKNLDYWGWCVYLTEYSHVTPPAVNGSTDQPKLVPGGNVVYAASLVKRLPPGDSESDLSYHARLLQAGATIEIRADLNLFFAQPPLFSEYVRERFWLSRKIGSDGGRQKLLIAPLLPFILLFRITSSVLRTTECAGRLLASAPVIFLIGLVQSAGEFWGALGRTKK